MEEESRKYEHTSHREAQSRNLGNEAYPRAIAAEGDLIYYEGH